MVLSFAGSGDGVASAGAVDMASGAGRGFGDILVILAGWLPITEERFVAHKGIIDFS